MFPKLFTLLFVVLALMATAMAGVHKVRYETKPAPPPKRGLGILGGIKEMADDILSTAGVHNQ